MKKRVVEIAKYIREPASHIAVLNGNLTVIISYCCLGEVPLARVVREPLGGNLR
jgi:hypothetical protein